MDSDDDCGGGDGGDGQNTSEDKAHTLTISRQKTKPH